MKTIPFVKDHEAAFAQDLERRILELPENTGIRFVGVSVQPTIEGDPTYMVWLGCTKDFDVSLYDALIKVTFREEIAKGIKIYVTAIRGSVREKTLKVFSFNSQSS